MLPEDFIQAVRVWHHTYRSTASLLVDTGVSPMEWGLLYAASIHPNLEMADFAELLESTPAAISINAKRLAAGGLITIEKSIADGRRRRLKVTTKGRHFLEDVKQPS